MLQGGLSQSELARRVGVTQGAIAKIARNNPNGSSHLHRIARVLGTTPAYLAGEVDDPAEGAAPPPPVPAPRLFLQVELPSEEALAAMFASLLDGIDPASPRDEQALLLAQRLPIGLSQLVDARPVPAKRARRPAELEAAGTASATPDRERRP